MTFVFTRKLILPKQTEVLERLRVGVRIGRRGQRRRRHRIRRVRPAVAQDFAEHPDEEVVLAFEAAVPVADVAGGEEGVSLGRHDDLEDVRTGGGATEPLGVVKLAGEERSEGTVWKCEQVQ